MQGVVAPRAEADDVERMKAAMAQLERNGLFALDEHKIDLAKAYTAIRCGRSDDAARLIETVLSHIDSAWRTYA